MKKHLLVCLIGLLSIVGAYGNSGRTIYPLDKGWGIKPITEVKKDVELKPVTIPHTWNAEYLEGTSAYNRELMIYKRKLQVTPEMKGKEIEAWVLKLGKDGSSDIKPEVWLSTYPIPFESKNLLLE